MKAANVHYVTSLFEVLHGSISFHSNNQYEVGAFIILMFRHGNGGTERRNLPSY